MNHRPRLNALHVIALAVLLAACAGQDTSQSAGEFIDDAVITSKVKTALLKDDNVNGLDVKVETFRGVVQLAGFVASRAERQRAAQIARKVAGVKAVENDIRLKRDP